MKNLNKSSNFFYWFYLGMFSLVLALPALSNPPYFFPPDWGKAIVFRILISILFFGFLWQIFYQKSDGYLKSIKENLFKNITFWILIALLSVFFLATIFSADINFSLWGSPFRGAGFVTFAFYIIFSILGFLIIQPKDWQKLWTFSFVMGIFISIIAVLQRFSMFVHILAWEQRRAGSTAGGPIFLAMYLLFPVILSFCFGIKVKNWKHKVFYFTTSAFFLMVIVFITQTRAVMLGLAIGLFYFAMFYPMQNKSLAIKLKIAALSLIIIAFLGICYININPNIPQFGFKNYYLKKIDKELLPDLVMRLSIKNALGNSRFSSWKVSWPALMARPIFGYGPENFAVGFDKFYNPALPGINIVDDELNSWWDRAHNFIFDIANTAGIPALLIFLSLFGFLFWKLEKTKKNNYDNKAIIHGIQTIFIAYIISNFFSFDTFPSYLPLFFTISYAMFLTKNPVLKTAEESFTNSQKNFSKNNSRKNKIIIAIGIVLIIFIWFYNIKPLIINAPINIAQYFSSTKQCDESFAQMEKIINSHSFIDSYVRMEYVSFIKKCAEYNPENDQIYAKKGVELLKEAVKTQPTYTRFWLFLGSFTNVLIGKEQDATQKQNLIAEANSYFEKTAQLSPNRQEIYIEWAKTKMLSGDYQGMKEKAEKCIKLNPELGDCYWMLQISELYLKNYESAQKAFNVALAKGYQTDSIFSLNQLANAYAELKDYKNLALTYEKLIKLNPSIPQYYASLSFTYAQMGRYTEARQQALKFLELMPTAKDEVNAFLKTLPY